MTSSKKNSIFEWIIMCVIAIALALVIKHFIFSVTLVSGDSMNPTLETNDRLIVNRIKFSVDRINYGDIIELHAPDDANKDYIKRIVALPGDTVEIRNNKVVVNNKVLNEDYTSSDETLNSGRQSSWALSENEYFVLGDNRLPGESKDSRIFGPIQKETIVGKAIFRFWPVDKFGSV